jgi:hypothetical protein
MQPDMAEIKLRQKKPMKMACSKYSSLAEKLLNQRVNW